MTPRCVRTILGLLALAPALPAAEPASPAPAAPARSYPLETYAAVGSSFAQNSRLADLGWNEAQYHAFLDGVRAAIQGKPVPLDDRARALLNEIGRQLRQVTAQKAQSSREFFADAGRLEAYMKQASKNFQMERSDSGLAFGLLSRGGGSRPGPDDLVVVSYKATAADGQTDLPQLGADHRRVKVAELLPGLAEGIQMLTPGSTAMLILPPALSFADGEWPPGVDRGTPLIFALVLHEVVAAP